MRLCIIFFNVCNNLCTKKMPLCYSNATLQALIGQLGIMSDLLKQNPEKLSWLDNSLEQWAQLIAEEAKLISGVKKSDKERYKKLP